ncbi:MAG: phosphoadenylyl-sulfate reductase [Alphaproteobacteria bacterium]|nr:phosphoadenylyl-sulfate reductase [Alphaproteobacteria bacterium]
MTSRTSLTRLSMFYGGLDALPLLRIMIRDEFMGRIGLISSFGADAALLLSMVAEIDVKTPVLFLETGKHFPETLDYARTLTEKLGLKNVHWLKPDEKLLSNIDAAGTLWQTQPNRCCWLRKVEPLDRAVRELGIEALITGRKRYQTVERAELQAIELDDKNVFRINPLASWSKERQKEEVAARGLPEHPLVAKGYLSIGCEPCTAPVAEGQDERAGRWAHTIGIENEQKTECGIHLGADEVVDWSV